MDNVEKLTIIPARFSKYENDQTCLIDCLIGNDKNENPIVQQRRFENEMIGHMENPSYLFIGLMHGEGFVQVMFTDAKEYKEMFIEKWGCLALTSD